MDVEDKDGNAHLFLSLVLVNVLVGVVFIMMLIHETVVIGPVVRMVLKLRSAQLDASIISHRLTSISSLVHRSG